MIYLRNEILEDLSLISLIIMLLSPGLSSANRAMEAYIGCEQARLKGCKVRFKSFIIFLDALNRAEIFEQATIVGAVSRESSESRQAAKSL